MLLFDAELPADVARRRPARHAGHRRLRPLDGLSNYNKLTRPPVVFVRDGDARLVVRRETFDDLLATDVG